jgi:hypothetical protein
MVGKTKGNVMDRILDGKKNPSSPLKPGEVMS